MSDNWKRNYDFAYTQAHNVGGLRDPGLLHNVARAYAWMRDDGHPVSASFVAFYDAWEAGLIVPNDSDGGSWHLEQEPVGPCAYFETADGRVGRRAV